MRPPTTMPRIPALAPVLEGADHIDVKVVIGVVSLRAFLAASLGYQPGMTLSNLNGEFATIVTTDEALRLVQDAVGVR